MGICEKWVFKNSKKRLGKGWDILRQKKDAREPGVQAHPSEIVVGGSRVVRVLWLAERGGRSPRGQRGDDHPGVDRQHVHSDRAGDDSKAV